MIGAPSMATAVRVLDFRVLAGLFGVAVALGHARAGVVGPRDGALTPRRMGHRGGRGGVQRASQQPSRRVLARGTPAGPSVFSPRGPQRRVEPLRDRIVSLAALATRGPGRRWTTRSGKGRVLGLDQRTDCHPRRGRRAQRARAALTRGPSSTVSARQPVAAASSRSTPSARRSTALASCRARLDTAADVTMAEP